MQVTRKAIREFRKVLESNGTYEDSKLAQLDEFEVKLTEFAAKSIVLKFNVKPVQQRIIDLFDKLKEKAFVKEKAESKKKKPKKNQE